MHLIAALPLVVFILSWIGAAASWAIAAYSVARVWTVDSVALMDRHRGRTMTAALWSATFIATGVLSGFASGVFHHAAL